MEEEFQQPSVITKKVGVKQHNTLPFWGNEASMNLNPLILANIQGSSYFKVHLFKLKTYHEVVDEIYYEVKHLEPWERGSRKTSGQTGMCGGVRGVGAGGIVSTAFCLLYKLYTLRLTRKQVNGLLNHTDSPYIRALGFMYLRYTQPPADLYDWYADYLQDDEEIDVKAGGGQLMTIGQMVCQFLTKLDWFSTLFPRIPVPIQKQIEKKVEQYCRENHISLHQLNSSRANHGGSWGLDDTHDRRGGGVRGNRDYFERNAAISGSNYRNDHDDRDYYTSVSASAFSSSSSKPHHRRDDYSPSPRRADRDRERERRHSVKHKRKHKHKHHSHSRSRSRSRSRSGSRSHGKKSKERRRDKDHLRSSDLRDTDYYSDRRLR